MQKRKVIKGIFILAAMSFFAIINFAANNKALEIQKSWNKINANIVSAWVEEASKPRNIHTYYKNQYILEFEYLGKRYQKKCANNYPHDDKLWLTQSEAIETQLPVKTSSLIYVSPDLANCYINVNAFSNRSAVHGSLVMFLIGVALALLTVFYKKPT